ncbi:FCD domain-containing protein [Nonomuraea sp. NPDC004297]
MRAAHEGLRPLPGNPAYEQLVAHRAFHAALYAASHNDLLIQTLDGLWDKSDRYRRLALEVERDQAARDRKAAEHEALLDHVIAGDADSAAAAMREHIDTSLGAQAAWRLRKHHAGEHGGRHQGPWRVRTTRACATPGAHDPTLPEPGTVWKFSQEA